MTEPTEKRRHFVRQIIEDDLASKKHENILTRFPPEPNGYLHIGHAKAIYVNFSMAEDYHGACNLRLDDTNPIKEEEVYGRAIEEDVKWLGFEWNGELKHASDYYDYFFECAISLIQQDLAYVDSLSMEEIREYRGTLQQPGKESPYRTRPMVENLDLFTRMRDGDFKDGEMVLRAKIDMSSGNLNMRDPVIFRIRHANHPRTGDKWCVYPMYDFAHPLSDAVEKITHSLCSLEFQDHRPLYDWVVHHCPTPAKPQQIEFARLNVSHTITSKRRLRQLVEEDHVEGWDDPRMPTLRGLRRRGFPAAAIRNFCEMTGLSKGDSVIDMSVLEECVRDELNQTAPRAMAVLNPLKIIIENFPEGEMKPLTAPVHPNKPELGDRILPFTRELYIERDDFMEEPEKKFFRLAPGKEVRLRNAYVIKCEKVVKDANGEVVELHCTLDPDTLGKNPEGRKVKGVIHWLSCQHALPAHVNIYDRLFNVENPAADEDFMQHLNPESLHVLTNCFVEPELHQTKPEDKYQFERLGYFCTDKDSTEDHLIFNRVVALRDTWK